MINIIMHGCNGAMGHVITDLIKDNNNIKIVAGVDINKVQNYEYPVYASLNEVKETADVIIDFANIKGVEALLDYCSSMNIPVVLCTTGLSEIQIKRVEEISEKVAVLRSANMSLGVNLLLKIVADAAKVLSPAGFDIEIVEKHHNRKLDAPSGTALALADSINHQMEDKFHYVYDRSVKHEARDTDEIGISSVRAGSIVGDHDVIFAGEDEVITFSHTAYSRKIFAKGAISAAEFLIDKSKGLYTMADVIA